MLYSEIFFHFNLLFFIYLTFFSGFVQQIEILITALRLSSGPASALVKAPSANGGNPGELLGYTITQFVKALETIKVSSYILYSMLKFKEMKFKENEIEMKFKEMKVTQSLSLLRP